MVDDSRLEEGALAAERPGLDYNGVINQILRSTHFNEETPLGSNVPDAFQDIDVHVSGLTLLQHGVKIMMGKICSCCCNPLLHEEVQGIKAKILSEFIAAILQASNFAPRCIKTEPCKDGTSSIDDIITTEESMLKSLKTDVMTSSPEPCKDGTSSIDDIITTEESMLKSLKTDVMTSSPELKGLSTNECAKKKKRIYRLQKIKSCPACSYQFCSIAHYPKSFLQHVHLKHKGNAEQVLERYKEKMTVAFR